MNIRLLTSTLIILLTLNSQSQQIDFERVLPVAPAPQIIADFPGISNGVIKYADVDADMDYDVFLAGSGFAQLYINAGDGNFTEVEGSNFPSFLDVSAVFTDLNADNAPDLLLAGYNTANGNYQAVIYLNDGQGNFTEYNANAFPSMNVTGIAYADVDADNDQDLLLTGFSNTGANNLMTRLYINDGAANFTLQSGTSFQGVSNGDAAFADMDGDGDQDLLITGSYNDTNGINFVAKIYLNDGSGLFSLQNSTNIQGVDESAIDFADVDGDNDLDVFIAGSYYASNGSGGNISKLYLNDGNAHFTESTINSFPGARDAYVLFADIDGDNDMDLFLSGDDSYSSVQITKLYTNDGNAHFTEVTNLPFQQVMEASIAVFDADADTDLDIIIGGYNGFEDVTEFYLNNNNTLEFTLVTGSPFYPVGWASMAFADIDNDNDQDILISGTYYKDGYEYSTKLYTNDGNGNYSPVTGTPFAGVYDGDIAFADVDNDNDMDVLITGFDGTQLITVLYLNDNAVFTQVSNTPFPGVYESAIDFADVDNDSDMDLIISGVDNLNNIITRLYLNDGTGNFTESNQNLQEVYRGDVGFIDVDGDNDPDLLITGDGYAGKQAQLYINDGNGNFTLENGTVFTPVDYSSIDFADVDSDSDTDILIAGDIEPYGSSTQLYLNDGSGNFTPYQGGVFQGLEKASVKFGDMNNDNRPDIIITGENFPDYYTKVYLNDYYTNFTEVTDIPFPDVAYGAVAFADIDNDNDQDLVIAGREKQLNFVTFLYRNILPPFTESIAENKTDKMLIYPNPAQNIFHLLTQEKPVKELYLFNIQGQSMPYEYNPETHEVKVNLPKGLYFLQFKIGKQQVVNKLMIQ